MGKDTVFFSAVVERDALVKALGQVQRIVEKRNTIPILSHVLI
jgi:DNA polymerase III sliding clamp (beta) subunit (PCNA family)